MKKDGDVRKRGAAGGGRTCARKALCNVIKGYVDRMNQSGFSLSSQRAEPSLGTRRDFGREGGGEPEGRCFVKSING